MRNNYLLLFFLYFFKISSIPICKESKNYCSKCNPLTNLCIVCEKEDILIPNDEGGCIGAQKCIAGNNYCLECNTDEKLCKTCDQSYYPDENGGCSFTNDCKISYKGECLECKEDFILFEKNKICKSIFNEDLKHCKYINTENGKCKECEEGYHLGKGDKKCTKYQNCYESTFGNCIKCEEGFYYDKKEDKCKEKNGIFNNCKKTTDGKSCDICDTGSYFDEEGICVQTKFCEKSIDATCSKCKEGYILSSNGNNCVNSDNCYIGDKDTGLCIECNFYYYIDSKDYKCRTNIEDNDYKYCEKVDDDICVKCESGYYLGKDNKCTFTRNCEESVNGKCILCSEKFYLGKDNHCSNIEHCIYSRFNFCQECEDEYYYNFVEEKCLKDQGIEEFENCKYTCPYPNEINCCECKKDYYLIFKKSLCKDNSEKGPLYKCSLVDDEGGECLKCIEGYYLGSEDKLCTLNNHCKISENENVCKECEENYCLDINKGKCFSNKYLEKESDKIYFACLRTNKDGTKCEECKKGYEVNEKGICNDAENCEEKKEDGICMKCNSKMNEKGYYYCSNNVLGCIEGHFENCLRCDNLNDLYSCTECKEGYEMNQYRVCVKKN